jgi:hypothetical protein
MKLYCRVCDDGHQVHPNSLRSRGIALEDYLCKTCSLKMRRRSYTPDVTMRRKLRAYAFLYSLKNSKEES